MESAATPRSDSEVQASPAPPPSLAMRSAAKPAQASRRPAQPAAWDQLAGTLGIEIPPAPPPQPVPSKPAASATPRPKETHSYVPPFAETPKEIVEIDVEAEAALPVWSDLEPSATEPESFEPQEALDIMDETAGDDFDDEASDAASAASESAAGEGPSSEQREGDERRPRRRRRRRGRGRCREDATSAEGGAAGEHEKGYDHGEEPSERESIVSEGAESNVDGPSMEPSETDRAERPERRGRRRGRGRDRDRGRDPIQGGQSRGEGEGAREEGGREEGSREGTREEDAADDEFDFPGPDDENSVGAGVGDEHDFDGDEDGDEEGGESPRIGFRNIPTWHDAIGMMIAKNMEARARNPGGQRGPGGRGGQRGGRGRGRRPDRR